MAPAAYCTTAAPAVPMVFRVVVVAVRPGYQLLQVGLEMLVAVALVARAAHPAVVLEVQAGTLAALG